ncbi:MAG: hypothetical protein SVK08_02045 [Halobacteriota archaeon]|nr:hypothetical protein [Halobacteriota archaeon]
MNITPGEWKAAECINRDHEKKPYICIFSISDAETAPARAYGDTEEQMRANATAIESIPKLIEMLQYAINSLRTFNPEAVPEGEQYFGDPEVSIINRAETLLDMIKTSGKGPVRTSEQFNLFSRTKGIRPENLVKLMGDSENGVDLRKEFRVWIKDGQDYWRMFRGHRMGTPIDFDDWMKYMRERYATEPVTVQVDLADGITDEDLDPEDGDVTGGHEFEVPATILFEDRANYALDQFHRSVPISLLECYDIWVEDQRGEIIDENPDTESYTY